MFLILETKSAFVFNWLVLISYIQTCHFNWTITVFSLISTTKLIVKIKYTVFHQHFNISQKSKINTQRQNQSAVSWEEEFLKFYRFFRNLQTWSASDHIFVSFHVLAFVWEFIFLVKTEWVNTQKRLAHLLPGSCKIFNLQSLSHLPRPRPLHITVTNI